MRLFIEVVWLAVKQQLHYRLAIFAGLVTNFFFAILRAALFIALYSSGQSVGNLTASQLLSFVAVSQGLIAFMSVFSYFDIMRTVYSGAVGADLLRPIDFFKYWLGEFLLAIFSQPGCLLVTGWHWFWTCGILFFTAAIRIYCAFGADACLVPKSGVFNTLPVNGCHARGYLYWQGGW